MTYNFSDIHGAVNNFTHFKTSEYRAETKEELWNKDHWKKYFPKMAEVNSFYTSMGWVGSRTYYSLKEDINT